MNDCPSVAVIILTFNSESVIERCVKSFFQIDYPRVSFFFVDNVSEDATVSIIKEKFPPLNLTCSEMNGGYTGGNNIGLEMALTSGYEYILVVNPDTVLLNPGFIASLVSEFEKQEDVGIAGPRVFFRSTQVVQNTILFPPALKRNIAHWIRYRWDSRFAQLSSDEIVSAQMLNGVCVMIRAECLRQIGLFDESYFMYIEDADLAHRAHLAGWQIKYFPVDSVIHEQKQEGYEATGSVAGLLKRNSAHYLVKNDHSLDAFGYAVFSLFLSAGKLFFSTTSLLEARKQVKFLRHMILKFFRVLTRMNMGRRYTH